MLCIAAQYDMTNSFRPRRTAWLSRDDRVEAACSQVLGQQSNLC